MKAAKLAPIFLKNFRPPENKVKESKKRRGRPKKSSQDDVPKKHETVINCDDDSSTEFYFTEEEERLLIKKFKYVSSEEDLDIELIGESIADSSSSDAWTNKYKEFIFKDRICCQESFSELYLWLTGWKSSQSCSQGSVDSGDEPRSCLLVYGPPGTGKTSLIYAVAEELNFKVFEVNCSSRRNGRAITERLKEATESLTINRNKFRLTEETGEEHKSSAPTLLQFFKKSDKKENSKKSISTSLYQRQSSQSNGKQSTDLNDSTISNISITNDSLLLFDDVDVLFDEDDGFWRAVNTLVESGKPVLLTASHSLERIRTFVDDMKVLKIKPPSNNSLVKLLHDVASQENISFPEETSDNLMVYFDGDIRRCLNELQFYGTKFLNNEKPLNCDCDELYSHHLYESGVILESLLIHANTVDITQRRDMFMQAFPLEIPDRNWNLLNGLQSQISELSLNVHKHWNCKFNSPRIISPFAVDEDTQELLNIRTLLPFNPSNSTVTIDYLPYLYEMCTAEEQRREKFIADSRRCRRFYHYFDSISFFITDKLKHVLINRFRSSE